MTSIQLIITGAKAEAKVRGPLTGGMTGIRVNIQYDKSWDGLIKTLVCRSSVDDLPCDVTRIVLDAGTQAVVAHEVMIAGRKLYLGIEGRIADGTEVYPTVWADCGRIRAGANADADPTVDPTPEVWAQVQAKMGSLEELETEDKSSLVAAINEARSNDSVSEEQVEKILADYLQENNITDGKDGVSATHEWSGTTLTVTSASGTSSADLKGDKGDDGVSPEVELLPYADISYPLDGGVVERTGTEIMVKDASGTKIAVVYDGYTPVRGTDYWTKEDQSRILDDCGDLITQEMAKAERMYPEFVNSVEECTDSGKLYVLPDGYIYAYIASCSGNYTNMLAEAVESDGSAYNGGQRWKADTRLNSSGSESESDSEGLEVTGFIPVAVDDVLHLKNVQLTVGGDRADKCYVTLYDASFNMIGYWRADFTSETQLSSITTDGNNNVTQIAISGGGTFTSSPDNTAYVRMSAQEINDSSVITVNEEIVDTVGYSWQNTGHAFVPADYEDRIIQAETDIAALKKAIAGDMNVYGIVDSENNIIMTGSLIGGTYSIKYMAEDGTTIDIGTFNME